MNFMTIYLFIAYSLFGYITSLSDISPANLKCEYLRNPLSVDSPNPRLSWTFTANDPKKQNLTQKAYQILVASDRQKLDQNVGDLWDSNKVVSDRNTHIRYEGKTLTSGQTVYWKVRVWDQNDKPSDYDNENAFFGKGLEMKDWTAQWISAPKGTQEKALVNLSDNDMEIIKNHPGLGPVLYFRKPFKTSSKVKSAKVYSTAQGMYKLLINGQAYQNERLTPGYTDYRKTIEYQTYDITNLVKENNVLAALLGKGWFSGYLGIFNEYNNYGDQQFLIFELHIEYENGNKEVIKSDKTWKVSTGPVLYSDPYHGELYYEERELWGYHDTDYDDKIFLPVVTKPIEKKVNLVAQREQPIRIVETLKPKSKYRIGSDSWVFDFEQNMVGWVELDFSNHTDHKSFRVEVRHAEVINPDGSLYTTSYRGALATDIYVINEITKVKALKREPHFTYRGFRYVEVMGFPGEPSLDDIIGKVVHSDIPFVGHIETSNKMVNRLHLNTVWGQKANFISVPTDCPQRDERLGWTADAQIFAPTATYNADAAAFLTKWTRDLREAQSEQGAFTDVAPNVVHPLGFTEGAPAWGDAGVIVPYIIYKMYGDLQIIQDNYDAMQRWINYIWSANPNLIWTNRTNSNFGDWLAPGFNTSNPEDKDVISTAYFGYDTLLMSRMAAAINKSEDSLMYRSLHTNISEAFNQAFVYQSTGLIKANTQTAYLVGLAFDMFPEKLRPLAAKHLADNVRKHNNHLTTGFVGAALLCPMLTQHGYNDIAYELLLQDTYPSWGYMIKHNATTIWERWDCYTEEQGFQGSSFNHFALGSIGKWLYQSVAGIDQEEDSIGFKKILIRPNPGNGLSFVNSSYESVNGLITSYWATDENTFRLKTTIPVNSRATIDLRFSPNGGVHEVGSGSYEFEVKLR